jgi:quinoprotein glucose dehydrogenase
LLWSARRWRERGRGVGVCRGVTHWKSGAEEQLFVPIQNKIWCVDAKTGKMVSSFGADGAIDLQRDADRELSGPPQQTIVVHTPGGICGDVLIVCSRTAKVRGQPRLDTSAL